MVNSAYYETIFPLEQYTAFFKDTGNIQCKERSQSSLVFSHTDLYMSHTLAVSMFMEIQPDLFP